jgi:hypothetical protein
MRIERFLGSGIAVASALLMATPAIADGPSYADTVSFLQSKLRGPLLDLKNCMVSYKRPLLEDANYGTDRRSTFHVGALQITPKDVTNDSVTFTCVNGRGCVSFDDIQRPFVTFDGSSEDMARIVKAMDHLIELCQARPGKDELFK